MDRGHFILLSSVSKASAPSFQPHVGALCWNTRPWRVSLRGGPWGGSHKPLSPHKHLVQAEGLWGANPLPSGLSPSGRDAVGLLCRIPLLGWSPCVERRGSSSYNCRVRWVHSGCSQRLVGEATKERSLQTHTLNRAMTEQDCRMFTEHLRNVGNFPEWV